MKILVTGASGNVGQYVVKSLIALGAQVVVAGTNVERLRQTFGEDVTAVLFDFTDSSTYEDALHEVDRVFLMRPPHLGKPEDLYPFIDKMRDKNIKLVSFLSLMGVEKNTIPPHHKIEKYIEQSGLPFAHIRPGFFMQNISGIHAEEIRTMDEILIPAGNSQTSFIDAADIGEAAAILLQNPETYKNTAHTITGPEALNYQEVATILSEATGRTIRYNRPSFLKYRKHYIKVRKLEPGYVNVTIALYLMTRLGTAKAITNTFEQLTGRKAKKFKTFAVENLAVFCK
ncbi:MAG TPA: NAD(P)-dependent oxidoreductase [Clostridiales bacterium UBA8960]|jgi:uncharacterized protein YbjT (DUF2867 family)|nr:NAD(P)-dependent oxidoreductase [Clostridiales bacterium UBA8960]